MSYEYSHYGLPVKRLAECHAKFCTHVSLISDLVQVLAADPISRESQVYLE